LKDKVPHQVSLFISNSHCNIISNQQFDNVHDCGRQNMKVDQNYLKPFSS